MQKKLDRISNLCATVQTLESGKQHNSTLHILLRELCAIVQYQDTQIQNLRLQLGESSRPLLKR